MNLDKRYYTLVAGLPGLVHFERAERLPINRVRLDQRLQDLDPVDVEDLSLAEVLLEWQHYPLAFRPEQLIDKYRKATTQISNMRLQQFIEFRMDQRSVLVGLRRRRLGHTAPEPGDQWGIGPSCGWIEAHWERPDFDLGGRYPWLSEARTKLEGNDAIGLERLVMDGVWQHLGRIADDHPFGFEEVFAYVFRWDILNRWLSYRADVATQRFQELVTEAVGEYKELLN